MTFQPDYLKRQWAIENIQTKEEWLERTKETGRYLNFHNFNDYGKATRAAKRDDNFPKALPQSLQDAGCASFWPCTSSNT